MSMGGLIARYGLAEMTKRPNDPTQTRLLVLHDSPQRGAYNPLGTQSLTRSFSKPFLFGKSVADFKPELGAAIEVLNEPVSQQLSILNVFNSSGDIRPNTFLTGPNSPYRQMVENVPGATYTIVATSDGSQCGTPQSTPVGVELTRTSRNHFLPPLLHVIPSPPPSPTPYPYDDFTLFTDIAAYGLPTYGQQAEISHARIWIQYDLCIGFSPLKYCWSFKHYLLNESAPSPANTLPYETLPGGNTNYKQGAGDCANLTGVPGFFLNATLYDGDVCFVPTFSALDLLANTPADAYAAYVNNTTTNSAARTGSPQISQFIAQEQNGSKYSLTHLRYTARNSEWIYNEMQRPFFVPTPTNNNVNPLACSATGCNPAATLSISGPLTLCTVNTGPATYTSPLQGPGYTYSWSASPCSAFTVCSGTGPTFQTSEGSNQGPGTLTLVVNTGCVFTFTKQLVMGPPAQPYWELNDPTTPPCYAGTGYFHIANYDPTLLYSFTVSGARAFNDGGGHFRIKAGGQSLEAFFTVTATNNCGSSSNADGYVSFECPSQYTVYPNPADAALTVEQTDSSSAPRSPAARGASSSTAPSTPYTVRLFDNYGVQQVQQATTTPTLQLSTGSLPTGLYLLHIEAGGVVVERRRIQITH